MIVSIVRLVLPLATLGLDAAWLWIAIRFARGGRRVWVAAGFLGLEAALFAVQQVDRLNGTEFERALPPFFAISERLWHLVGLGASALGAVVACLLIAAGRWRRRLISRAGRGSSPACERGSGEAPVGEGRHGGGRSGEVSPSVVGTAEAIGGDAAALATRREFLRIAAVALPPLFTIGVSAVAMAQDSLRVRRIRIPIPGLPRELDGFSIAQVSDLHVGEFTSEHMLRAMVARVNDLRADLVAYTGDLIHREHRDLSHAIDLVRSTEGRLGTCIIEGNHDLYMDPPEFRRRIGAAGLRLLRNDSTVAVVRGRPVELLGLPWVGSLQESSPPDEVFERSTTELLSRRDPEAFPILLAHHPHAFDTAARAGVPLTLSGHTHGGQWMLGPTIGAGPVLFRYWSGHYTRGASHLVVSNGVGNVFPLRVGSPAEVVLVTLASDAAQGVGTISRVSPRAMPVAPFGPLTMNV